MEALISVIIPCCNGANYLHEAVASVLDQNVPVEIIVIDDGSTDKTAAVAQELSCVVRSIPHSGLSAARNAGLQQAHGAYILFLDHDDVIRDAAVQRLLAAFEQDGAPQIVMAQAVDFISPELDEADKKVLAPRPEPYYGLLSGAVLIRKDVFSMMDAFTENLATGQTMDFFIRAENAGARVAKCDFIAVNRRLHNNNMGRTMQKQENTDYASILRMKLRRKE